MVIMTRIRKERGIARGQKRKEPGLDISDKPSSAAPAKSSAADTPVPNISRFNHPARQAEFEPKDGRPEQELF